MKQCTGSLQGCEHTMENKEGDIGIFGFVVFGFSVFSIRFLVFIENNSGFSVLLSNVVFGFSYFESK